MRKRSLPEAERPMLLKETYAAGESIRLKRKDNILTISGCMRMTNSPQPTMNAAEAMNIIGFIEVSFSAF